MKTVAALSLALIASAAMAAAPPAGLSRGGYVIVMRHAHAPDKPPPNSAERQLDDVGRAQALAVGEGIRARRVSLAPVYSSPTLRAVQTVRLLQLPLPETRPQLDDGGTSMAAAASGAAGAAWLRAKAAEQPPPGHDMLIVTQGPNIVRAFGAAFKNLADGEAAVFRPNRRGGFRLAARIRVEDWRARGR
jgi:hypothetical protein